MNTAPNATRIGIAIVEDNEKFLVNVRNADVVLAGMHEFPGGKCDPLESPAECAIRECYEETGVRVEVVELLDHTCFEYSYGTVDLHFFLCRATEIPEESSYPPNLRWVPAHELTALNFPEGNRNVINLLMDRYSSTRWA